MLITSAAAPATLQMSTGLRYVVPTAPDGDCSAKAKSALTSQLTNAFETAPGTGIWMAYGPNGEDGHPSATAAIHCYPVGHGFVVTFTCAVDAPPSIFGADDLCTRLGESFQGKAVATPTPIPEPTGCSLVNLVGVWVSNDQPGVTLTMDAHGHLQDQEGVVGSWALSGNTVTLTYYGTTTDTLSADGKRISGRKNLTRKC